MGAPYNLLSTLSSIYTLPSLLLYIFLTFSLNPEAVFLFFLTPLHATTCQSGSALSPVPPPPHPPTQASSPLCVSAQSWRSKRRTRVGERKQTEEGEGPSQARRRPAGRSGAAPPVIIRVTAAQARLCAACTRRDVLPREKSEHLSVPPRRQQPPTSLSNSTQVVTRSPNSSFLSLVDSRTPTLNSSALLFLPCSLAARLLRASAAARSERKEERGDV